MILKNTNLFELPERFTIEVPECEMLSHFERAKQYKNLEIFGDPKNKTHRHGLKSEYLNLKLVRQYFWDSEKDIFIVYVVEIRENSLRVLRTSLGGIVDAMRYNPRICMPSNNSSKLLNPNEKIKSDYVGFNGECVFDEALSIITNKEAFCKVVWFRLRCLDTYFNFKDISPRIVSNDR
jgi:hypothetical protein